MHATPSGRPFTQELAVELSERPWLIFTPARYEGIDRRVIDEYGTRMPVYEVSIGDYVLAGGEAAVLVITEAVARLLPGVLRNAESHRDAANTNSKPNSNSQSDANTLTHSNSDTSTKSGTNSDPDRSHIVAGIY